MCSIYLHVLIFSVFLFGPAPFVCRNMAELNVDDPSFWFNDVLAARDEDEAIVVDCYEAATDASDYAMLAASVGVTVMINLNSAMINLNSVMINLILNFLMRLEMKQWRHQGKN